MPGPEPKRKRATGTRTFDRGDESRDAKQKLKSFSEDTAVQDRIRSWQVQNVEEAVDLDALSVRSRPRSEAFRTPISSRAASPITKEPQTTPRKRSTKWVQQDNKQWTKERRSMRYSHEKTDLHHAEEVDVQQNEVRSDQMQHDMPSAEYTRDDNTHARNVTKSRAEREERRKRRREARARLSGDNNTQYHQDSHPAISPKQDHDQYSEDRSRNIPTPSLIESETTDAQRWAASNGTLQPGDSSPEMQGNGYIPHTHAYQQSKYAQTLGKGNGNSESIQPPKSRKLTILSKTREMLGGRTDAPQTPSNRIPSIEAWLEEQPGPSFEHDDGKPQPSHDVKSSKRHSRKKKISVEPTIVEIDDPNKIWDAITAPNEQVFEAQRNAKKQTPNISAVESETSPSKRRLFSFEVPEDSSKGAGAAPPPPVYTEHEIQESNLHRRGAKSRRARSYNISESAIPPIVPAEETRSSQLNGDKTSYDSRPSKSKPDQVSTLTESIDVANSKADSRTDTEPAQRLALKRKLTHEDLLSILSQPRVRKSTKSVRSVRRAQNESPNSILPALLEAMRNEEPKYNQELRTLVDGVTPVLLQSLLSKADAEVTLGLFSNDENQDVNYTKPIIQMGIALERLKALHSRIPLGEHEVDALLVWASTAQKYYQDYIKWWRLGFHGILVNLAPLGTPRTTEEELMARDLDGDLTDADGQKADVAYLQKRPLVRLKKISKLISAIRDERPTNDKASRLADTYAELTEKAKQRYNEEQGRLEDETAANIDISRARDLKTMAPLTSVQIDKGRKVRARDCFELTLYHSTGQRMDCRIEIIIRDDPQPQGTGGDILICQIEEKSKWLLFAPINIGNVSARRDESSLDIVLMIRGVTGISENWHELLALKADVPDAVVEWVQMLGSSPLPPKLRENIPIDGPQKVEPHRSEEPKVAIHPNVSPVRLSMAALASLPSDVDVPIGEPSVLSRSAKKQDETKVHSEKTKTTIMSGPKLSLGGGLQKKEVAELSLRMKAAGNQDMQNLLSIDVQHSSSESSSRRKEPPSRHREYPKHPDPSPLRNDDQKRVESLLPARPLERLRQPNNVKISPHGSKVSFSTASNVASQLSSSVHTDTDSQRDNTRHNEVPLIPDSRERQQSDRIRDPFLPDRRSAAMTSRSADHSEAREEAKSMQNRPPAKSKASTSLTETIRERWAAVSGHTAKPKGVTTESNRPVVSTELVTDNYPTPQLRPPRDLHQEQNKSLEEKPPPPPPPHRTNASPTHLPFSVPNPTTPHGLEIKTDSQWVSRSQREDQSSSSTSASDSEEDDDVTSDTSEEDYGSELKDQATPLVAVAQGNRRKSQLPSKVLPSLPSSGSRTLQPSDSASNAPYRRAPSPSAYPASKKRRTIAMICSWSDRGVWQPIQDEECSIVISPGLVQAFKITAAHSQPMAGAAWEDEPQASVENQAPLVEFELTPIVPLRKGTALDITIRSPPTAKSTIRTTNNVMFRSKTPQDCDKLYQLINWARCNNPTYAQLARSRAREETLTFNPNAPSTKTRSWFSFGSHQKTSYRASSQPPPSMADTGVSGSSSFSAFSALKRFGKNSPFSLKRSSVVRRSGLSVTGESLYSSSNGTGSGSGTSTPAPSQAGFVPGPDGPNVPETSAEAVNGGGMVNNMKVHLFLRQGQKWEQLGQCHLTVLPAVTSSQAGDSTGPSNSPVLDQMRPPQSTTAVGPSAMSNARTKHYRLPSSGHTPHKIHGDGREKRILITSVKNKGIVLLDETLGESCFEKIMQTGIAINVWKEDEAVQDRGGVLTGRGRTYMIQFKTSMEASWVFNMCGVYRYGHTAAGN